MQSLQLVGFTEDRTGLLFAAADGGGGDAEDRTFVLPIDDRLIAHVGDAARRTPADTGRAPGDRSAGPRPARPAPTAASPGSALTPREIQARLRTGRSVDEVAAEAGVDAAWIERFAPPVEAEQAAAVARAVALPMSTARRGSSTLPLLSAVSRALRDRGLALSPGEVEAGWSAHQHNDGQWVVGFRFRSHSRAQYAEWLFDAGAGTVAARNRLANDLGWVAPDPGPAGEQDGAAGDAHPVAPAAARPRGRPSRLASGRGRTPAPVADPDEGAGTDGGAGPVRLFPVPAPVGGPGTPAAPEPPAPSAPEPSESSERSEPSEPATPDPSMSDPPTEPAAVEPPARPGALLPAVAGPDRSDDGAGPASDGVAQRPAEAAAERAAARRAAAAERETERAAARRAAVAARQAERAAAKRIAEIERAAARRIAEVEREAARRAVLAERQAAAAAREAERTAQASTQAARREADRQVAAAGRAAAARVRLAERDAAKRIAAAEDAAVRAGRPTPAARATGRRSVPDEADRLAGWDAAERAARPAVPPPAALAVPGAAPGRPASAPEAPPGAPHLWVGPDDVDGGPDQAGPVGGDWDGAPLGEAQRAAVLARQVARQAAREAAREAARRELAAAAEARQAARRTPDAARRRTEPDTPILRSVGDGGAGSNR